MKAVKPLRRAEVEALDPGVRRLVVLLRSWNFETCDSGDGRSKPGAGVADDRGIVEVQPMPHVVIEVPALDLLDRFGELLGLLEQAAGVQCDCGGEPDAPMLQGAIGYDRSERKVTGFLEVCNVSDADLPAPLLAWLDQEIAALA